MPLSFIKKDIKQYFEEEGIKKRLPYGFGNEFAIRLSKSSEKKYRLKKGRMNIEELETFPDWTVSEINTKSVINIIFKG